MDWTDKPRIQGFEGDVVEKAVMKKPDHVSAVGPLWVRQGWRTATLSRLTPATPVR